MRGWTVPTATICVAIGSWASSGDAAYDCVDDGVYAGEYEGVWDGAYAGSAAGAYADCAPRWDVGLDAVVSASVDGTARAGGEESQGDGSGCQVSVIEL